MTEKHLLTDLSLDYWKNLDYNTLEKCIENVQERIKNQGGIYGETQVPDAHRGEIMLNNACIFLTEVTLIGTKIFGTVVFLDKEEGHWAYYKIHKGTHRFGIRASGVPKNHEGLLDIKRIYTWDILEIPQEDIDERLIRA